MVTFSAWLKKCLQNIQEHFLDRNQVKSNFINFLTYDVAGQHYL